MTIGVPTFFAPEGGGSTICPKILTSHPNFYQTVERKQGSYDALTNGLHTVVRSENILTCECII